MLAAGLTVTCLLVPAAAHGGASTFVLDDFSLEREPGDSFVVTGAGCPPSGPFPTSAAVRFLLTPPMGGNGWYPGIVDGSAGVYMSQAYIAGESYAETQPAPDGSFTISITVPPDAPIGDGYTVRAMCLTLLEPRVDDPDDFTAESAETAMTEAGVLGVIDPNPASPTTTTTTPEAPDAEPAVTTVAPRFTG
jgi:hypothetical protein